MEGEGELGRCFPSETWPPSWDHKQVINGIFWIARAGAPWRDLADKFGKWGSILLQFLRWTRAKTWDVLIEALANSQAVPESVQMIDTTIARMHHRVARGKGGI
jgi:transposase